MVEKVEVKGGGDFDGAILKNAATEKTLNDLLELFKKKGKDGDKVLELQRKTVEKNIEATKETIDKHEEYQKTLKDVEKKSKAFGDTLASIAGTAVSGIFSGIVATGTLLTDFFKTSFTAFEKTNEVGASFNYSLLELRRAALDAALPLDEFVKTIQENGPALAAFGGTVTEGAKAFGDISKQFRDPTLNKELYNMGYNMESLNKFMASQLQLEMVSGRSRDLDRTKLAIETKDYIKDLNRLSKATGVSTDKLQEGVIQQMQDGRMMALQNKLSGKALANFREGLALMNAELDPKVFDTLKNMMSGVIDPADKFGAMLAVAAPGIMEFQEALGEGRLDITQQLNGYERQVDQIGGFLSKFSKQQIARMPELKAMQEYLTSIKKFTGENGKAALEAKKANDGMIGLFSSFGQIMTDLGNLFTRAFLSSGTIDKIQDAFNKLSAFIQEKGPLIIKKLEPVMERIGQLVDVFVNGIEGFINAFINGDLKPESIGVWLKDLFTKTMSIFADSVGAVLGGLLGATPEQQAKKDAYKKASPEQQEVLRKQDPTLAMPDFGDMFKNMGAGMQKLIDLIPSFSTLATYFGVGVGGAVIAGIGLGAGAAALAKGLTQLIIPVGALGLAIGVGAGGLGYAFNGFANIINAVSDSFKKISDFFTTMGNADPAKMKNAGESIKSLAGSMSDLVSAGFMGVITGGSLSSLADTLTKLNQLDADKLSAAGPALKSLHDGLTLFANGGILDSISNSFSSFFSGGPLDTLVEALKKLGDVDLSKLNSLTSLSSLFDTLKRIEDVDLSKLKSLTSLSSIFDTLKKLGDVDLSKLNSLTSLTSLFDALKKLEDVDLSKLNSLTSLSNIFDTLKQIGDVDLSKLNSLTSISSLFGTLKTLSDTDLTEKLKSNIDNFVKSIANLHIDNTNIINQINTFLSAMNSIPDSDVDRKISMSLAVIQDSFNNFHLDNNSIVSQLNGFVSAMNTLPDSDIDRKISMSLAVIQDSFKGFNIDTSNIDNLVSAIGKIKTSIGDTFQNQTNEVDKFSKSINNLIESLEKLENQMKDTQNNSALPKVGNTSGSNRNTTSNTPISITGISPEEYQRQLNMKIDELITHIKDMKQNTKDTADSLNGRRRAL